MLDEPTTGLDSAAALSIIHAMKTISSFGPPVLCSLLQPSWELLNLFHKVIILAGGEIAYWGPVSQALEYFESLGFQCPVNYNASEFLSEVVVNPGMNKFYFF